MLRKVSRKKMLGWWNGFVIVSMNKDANRGMENGLGNALTHFQVRGDSVATNRSRIRICE